MTSQARDGQRELFSVGRIEGPSDLPRLETVSRYRVTLVHEEETPYGDRRLANPSAVAQFLTRTLEDRPQEHMTAVYLDVRNHVIGLYTSESLTFGMHFEVS